jgi:hypothetical protein
VHEAVTKQVLAMVCGVESTRYEANARTCTIVMCVV